MRRNWYRAAAAAFAGACGLVAWYVWDTAGSDSLSMLRVLSICLTLGAGVCSLALLVSPDPVWEQMESRGGGVAEALREIEVRGQSGAGALLIFCGFAAYLGISGFHLMHPDATGDDDQGAYLQTAAEVRMRGGAAILVRDLFAGEFAEANRHPLYIGLLALRPTERFGRLLSTSLGLFTLALLTGLASRSHGLQVAGIFCLLLGTNAAYCLFSTRIVCEVLMVLWAGLAFWFALEFSARRFLLIGGCLAMAWLTKGTGLLLLAGFLLWSAVLMGQAGTVAVQTASSDTPVLPYRHASRRQLVAAVTGALFVWLLIASPLLTRNLRRYHAPFHNVNTSLLFVDEYEDPVQLSRERSTFDAAREYLRTHSPLQILDRATRGLVWETFLILRMLGPAFLEDTRILFGLPLAAFALIAVAAAPRPGHWLLLAWLSVCLPLFAWYIPVAAGERFPLVLLGPILLLSAEGIARLCGVTRART